MTTLSNFVRDTYLVHCFCYVISQLDAPLSVSNTIALATGPVGVKTSTTPGILADLVFVTKSVHLNALLSVSHTIKISVLRYARRKKYGRVKDHVGLQMADDIR